MIPSSFRSMILGKVNSSTCNVFMCPERTALSLLRDNLTHRLDLCFDYNLIWCVVCGMNSTEKWEGIVSWMAKETHTTQNAGCRSSCVSHVGTVLFLQRPRIDVFTAQLRGGRT